VIPPIICSLPEKREEPASFTRFMLPFSYKQEPWKGSKAGLTPYVESFGVSAERMVARREYFTSDTGTVLFDRAKWLVLDQPGRTCEVQGRNHAVLSLEMMPPRVVLLEWPGRDETGHVRLAREVMRTGFLLVDVRFLSGKTAWQIEDVLAFNDAFRYWRKPWTGHDVADIGGYTYRDLVPDYNASDPYFGRWAALLRHPVEIDGRTFALFPGADDGVGWFEEALHWQEFSDGKPGWIPYADNRTFVWSSVLLERGTKAIEGPEIDGIWIKLLNIDPPAGQLGECSQFEREWAHKRTYYRHAENGTLYGFSYHSGVLLGAKSGLPIARHFSDMYFDMVLLLFYLRVSCFRFSRELCAVSDHLPVGDYPDHDDYIEELRRLRLSFALFTNLYRFPLLSNLQQGLEMYEIAKPSLNIDGLYTEISDKIRAAHEYIEIQVAHKQNRAVINLTALAQFGLVLLLVLAFFSTTPVEEWIRPWWIRVMRHCFVSLLRVSPHYATAAADISMAVFLGVIAYYFLFRGLRTFSARLGKLFSKSEETK
jgi:hypothetical protein